MNRENLYTDKTLDSKLRTEPTPRHDEKRKEEKEKTKSGRIRSAREISHSMRMDDFS